VSRTGTGVSKGDATEAREKRRDARSTGWRSCTIRAKRSASSLREKA